MHNKCLLAMNSSGGGGYSVQMSIRGCAADMGRVFGKFMGRKSQLSHTFLQVWCIDG